jgi:hypothetical protein
MHEDASKGRYLYVCEGGATEFVFKGIVSQDEIFLLFLNIKSVVLYER